MSLETSVTPSNLAYSTWKGHKERQWKAWRERWDGGQVAVAGGPFEGVPGEAADLWCCLLLFLLGV